MTQLYVSILILAVYISGCFGVWLRLNTLAHRRAQREQMRRIMRYRALADKEPAKLYSFPGHSLKAPAA